MATLLDIATVSEFVKVPGPKGSQQEIEVFGVSAEGIASLLQRFPEMRMLMTGQELEAGALMKMAPDAIAAIIACSTGTAGNKKAEKIAAALPVEYQVDILESTIRLTMPHGIGPFARRLSTLAQLIGAGADGADESGGMTTEADSTSQLQLSS